MTTIEERMNRLERRLNRYRKVTVWLALLFMADVALAFNNVPMSDVALAAESGEGPDFYDQKGKVLATPCPGRWLLCDIPLERVEQGLNHVCISAPASSRLTLNDLRVWVRYPD